MINLAWPWFACLLPLPLIIWWLAKPKRNQHITINAPTLPYFANNVATGKSRHLLTRTLLVLSWLLIVLSLTRPQWLDTPIVQTFPSRDLLLAVDISQSMQTKDMTINGEAVDRLSMVKSYLQSFIKQRQGDRIGIILFADHAYLMVPFTQDWQATGLLLDEVNIGLAGKLTAIGEAITLAVKKTLHEPKPIQNKTLILLSDGKDSINTIQPTDAAALAKASGLKIYTIGIGADSTDTETESDLDETTLEEIADMTGGQYFRARSEQDLSEIYQQINLIEPLSLKTVTYQPRTELLVWPLSCLLLVMAMLLWILRND